MAEAAEESGKENYRNGWPPGGRKFSEADRESPAAREATEKENTAAAGSVGGRFQSPAGTFDSQNSIAMQAQF